MMSLFIEGIGLIGPGLDGWPDSRAVLAGDATYLPTPANLRASDMLPAAERRRAGAPIKLALAVAQQAFLQAGRKTKTAATVFTSSDGDCDNVHAINQILATAPLEMSPTRFHNSVHNAAAGYWCIAAESHEPSTSLCAHDASFVAGLLESATQVTVDNAVVALIAYDHPYPEPMCALRPNAAPFGMALIFTPRQNERIPCHSQERSPAVSRSIACPDPARSRPLQNRVGQDSFSCPEAKNPAVGWSPDHPG